MKQEISTKSLELKNTIIKTKSSENRMKETEERIANLKDKTIEIIQSEQKRENRLNKTNKENLRDLWKFNKGLSFMSLDFLNKREKKGQSFKKKKHLKQWQKISQLASDKKLSETQTK